MKDFTPYIIAIGLSTAWIVAMASPAEVVQTTVSILLFLGLSTHVYATWGDTIRGWIGGMYATTDSDSKEGVLQPNGTDRDPAQDEPSRSSDGAG